MRITRLTPNNRLFTPLLPIRLIGVCELTADRAFPRLSRGSSPDSQLQMGVSPNRRNGRQTTELSTFLPDSIASLGRWTLSRLFPLLL